MLTLRIIATGSAAVLMRSEFPLTQGGISIGRAPNNDITLDDPAVSRLHCRIISDGDGCIVHDQSSNGVLVNNDKRPIGKGESRRLSNGDRLRIGLYVVEIRQAEDAPDAQLSRFSALFADKEAAPPPAFQQSFKKHSGFEAFPGNLGFQDDPPTAQLAQGVKLSWGEDDEDDDPLTGGGAGKPWRRESAPAAADHAPADVHVFAPPPLVQQEPQPPSIATPAIAGVIGDDWDEELDETWINRPIPAIDPQEEQDAVKITGAFSPLDTVGEPSSPPYDPPPIPPATLEAPATSAAPPPVPAADEAELIAAFFEGVGAPPPIGSPWGADDMRRVGRLVREAVTGLVAVLDARAAVRSDLLGAQMTRWEAEKDNNPLKFIRRTDELLQRALAPKAPDYLDGPAAVRDALRDVRAHEMAMVNAVQTAGRGLVETFQPEKLKTRLEASGSFTGLFAMQRKARYWETYELLYASMARDLLDGVHEALGQRIADEYQLSLRKLEKEEDGQ